MKKILHLITVLLLGNCVCAQNYTLNWGSSFGSGWANGATTGTAFNIGGSGINCLVTVTKSGGVFASSSGISAPTVAYSLMTVPGSSNNLMVALDYTNPSQYTDITFTFTSVVYNLSFYLGDIDRLDNNSNSYFDKVTVNGLIGTTTISPVITKYNSTADPNFLIISGNTARVNTTSGMAGNTASDATDQKGTIKVDFNGSIITSFTIRYDNHSGVSGNPGLQFIGIGNISFRQNFPLAVELMSFKGENKNGKNTLNWIAANESEITYYTIEGSEDGKNFTEAGRIANHNSIAPVEYSFIDKTVGARFYRLKMLSIDGSFSYSKTVLVHSDGEGHIKVFPTQFTSSLKVKMQSQKEEAVNVTITDLSGRAVYRNAYKLKKGENEFSLELSSTLPKGHYFIVVGHGQQSIGIIKQ